VWGVLTKLARQAGELACVERAGRAGEVEASGGDGPGTGSRVPSDAEIIGLSLSDPGIFGVIFERHAREILRYAHARLGPDLAEEVVAETFLAAFGRRGRYDRCRADARPWLYGIAVRQIGRHRRAEQRRRRALARIPAETVAADFGDRSAERVTAQQLRPRLAAVLSGLPHQDRELLLLTAWAGLTYEESAQALGLPVSTVRSRLHRIRAKTRRALGGANPTHVTHEGTGHG
jgi:RNA polymerase sigma factor (sigma-70 family)